MSPNIFTENNFSPDSVAVSLTDHLPPVLRQQLGQHSLHLPVQAAVDVGVEVHGDEEVHVHAVGQVTQLQYLY